MGTEIPTPRFWRKLLLSCVPQPDHTSPNVFLRCNTSTSGCSTLYWVVGSTCIMLPLGTYPFILYPDTILPGLEKLEPNPPKAEITGYFAALATRTDDSRDFILSSLAFCAG